jgi:hypothetical protein
MAEEFKANRPPFLEVDRDWFGVSQTRLWLTEYEHYDRQHQQDGRQGDMYKCREAEERRRSLSYSACGMSHGRECGLDVD